VYYEGSGRRGGKEEKESKGRQHLFLMWHGMREGTIRTSSLKERKCEV
jgi:hypothetical protein